MQEIKKNPGDQEILGTHELSERVDRSVTQIERFKDKQGKSLTLSPCN